VTAAGDDDAADGDVVVDALQRRGREVAVGFADRTIEADGVETHAETDDERRDERGGRFDLSTLARRPRTARLTHPRA
jgi:hypothetical protein